DHLMKITHILRAQEWLPSGSLHILLYKAFGWDPPVYCHLPMVMGKDGKKLSKRHGATAVREFREGGYLPEAVINYVSLVGWSYDDSREFFTKEELEKLFDLKKINKAPGIFDYKKLEWFNGQYIRMKTDEELKVLLLPHLLKAGFVSDPPTKEEEEILSGLIPLVKERLRTISGIADLVRFIFEEINEYNPEEAVPKRLSLEQTIEVLENSRGLLDGFAERNDEENEEFFRQKAEEIGVKLGDLLMPIRIAVTGSKASPPLFGSIRLIGIEKTLSRINRLIETLRGGK
ncbi:MAG: glutamate--tRNA ligase, partial [Spirochaetales bacterium]|nr:glutamate--tRNA ligase [Spirochaetales bacterium]